MQRHMYNKHSNPVLSRTPNFLDNCKPFHFVHPFTCMLELAVLTCTCWDDRLGKDNLG